MMRRRGIAALAAGCMLLGVACTSVDDDRSVSPPLPTVDAQDPRPLLTVTGRSYIGEGRLDIDTPIYNLFADGSLVVIYDDGIEPAMYRTQLSVDERDKFIRLTEAAGLSGGGTQPSIAQPNDMQITDGGDGVYVRRVGDEYTVRAVAQPDIASGVAPPERAAFVELFLNMRSHFDEATAGERLAFDRWAVVRTSPTEDDLRRDLAEYDGPDIADDAWQSIGGEEECVMVTTASWPSSPAESLLARTLLDGKVITGRPLLPHQDNCADVAEFRSVLGL